MLNHDRRHSALFQAWKIHEHKGKSLGVMEAFAPAVPHVEAPDFWFLTEVVKMIYNRLPQHKQFPIYVVVFRQVFGVNS